MKLIYPKSQNIASLTPVQTATGEAIKIPAKTVVKIRPAKAFKDAIVPPKK